MKKILLIACMISVISLHAALELPINRPSKEETVILELIIKDIQDFINAQKPVAANSRMPDAEDEFKRVRMHLTEDLKKEIADHIENLKKTIAMQKEYQIKKYGKLLEVN